MVLSLAAKFLRLCGEDVGSNPAGLLFSQNQIHSFAPLSDLVACISSATPEQSSPGSGLIVVVVEEG